MIHPSDPTFGVVSPVSTRLRGMAVGLGVGGAPVSPVSITAADGGLSVAAALASRALPGGRVPLRELNVEGGPLFCRRE